KILCIAVFALASQINFAQTNEVFKKDVLSVIKISGGTSQMDLAKEQILSMIAKDKQQEFLKEFDATLPSLYDKIAEVYMSNYTHDEIKQMLKFYETPIGKKISSSNAKISKESMAVSQEWAGGLQGLMMKYMQ
ncbi:MAG: DUF2059 domain-containing protein, partial [Flavobacterium sp.]|nr:DUF2059 domain-containing protein [Candidatus Neoflavobacterium equi]